MAVVGDYKECGTAGVRGLDIQLIQQIQQMAPDALVSFAHLSVNVGSGCHAYLQAPAVRALELAIASRGGHRMIVNSAFRTIVQQTILWNHCQHGRCGITAAAKPGQSGHESGLCIDIEDAQGWRKALESHNYDWLGSWDPMHYSYTAGGTRNLQSLSIRAFQELYNFNHPGHALTVDGSMGAKTMNAILSTSVDGFTKLPDGIQQSIASTPMNLKFPSLRQGSTGESVKKLQKSLVSQGILIDQDGDFGESTLRAVKQFQLKEGLVADGAVGSATIKALGLN